MLFNYTHKDWSEREREREKENISISVQNLVFVSDPLLPVHQYNLTREAEYQCLV